MNIFLYTDIHSMDCFYWYCVMNYMSQHLLEAIEINQARMPLYAKLSNKQSLKISRTLILSEKIGLTSSFVMDRLSKYWQKQNVPIMKYEFIPMSETPTFEESFTDTTGICENLPIVNTKAIQKDIHTLFKAKNYQQIDQYIEKALEEFKDFTKHYCMVRHILESVRRANNLIPLHIAKAQQLEVKNPEKFCRKVLHLQITLIHPSKLFDRWAHPLQKDGIPIIYQDVPAICANVDNYQ